MNVGGTETFAALYDETGTGNSVNFSGGVGADISFSAARPIPRWAGIAGNISGALDLTQETAPTRPGLLSGNNTYTGGTYVESGTLVIASASALPVGRSLTVGISVTPLFDPAAAYSPVTPTFQPDRCRRDRAGTGVADTTAGFRRLRRRDLVEAGKQGKVAGLVNQTLCTNIR